MVCALWVMRYGAMGFELYDDEHDAANMASAIADAGTGSVVGVQFADGRLIRREDWAAYRAAEERREADAARWEQERRAVPQPETRKIRDPFYGHTVAAYVSAPDWLGDPKDGNNPA